MSGQSDITSICQKISKEYNACDISDALLKLKVPQAGFLSDISPIPRSPGTSRIVAPISTILFVRKDHGAGPFSSENKSKIPKHSNIDGDKHWTDYPAPGSIALLQQPDDQVCAICGDILATRLKVRGVKAVIADGRVRDLSAMSDLCKDGDFQVWSRALSTVGTGLEAKAWAADVSLKVGGVTVNAGDVMCADEGEGGCVVIPQERLEEVMAILPGLKEADEKCVADVQAGVDVTTAFKRHRN